MKRINKAKQAGHFIIMMKTDSEAFQKDPEIEVASILEDYAGRAKQRGLYPVSLRDSNGNTVGEVKVAMKLIKVSSEEFKRIGQKKRARPRLDPDIDALLNETLPKEWSKIQEAAFLAGRKWAENLQAKDEYFDFERWESEITSVVESLVENDLDLKTLIIEEMLQYGPPSGEEPEERVETEE